jgi:hypothetical protein
MVFGLFLPANVPPPTLAPVIPFPSDRNDKEIRQM